MAALVFSIPVNAVEISTPPIALEGIPFEVTVSGLPSNQAATLVAGDERYSSVADQSGKASFDGISSPSTGAIRLSIAGEESSLRVLPGWVSLLPAFTAIGVALLIRNVVPALLLGLWLGATALRSFTPGGAGGGLLDTFQIYVANALADSDHAAIILFTMMIGGMVGIITRNGGMMSIVRVVVSKAKSAIGGQVSVWAMGLMIFFDDYANTLVVGNTARPITDHLRISREKLAYIVDSTAAPVVCIALITTWIGYEVSLIDEALQGVEELAHIPAYSVFLNSIPYSFYPILAVFFVLMVSSTGKDFGPMLKAEIAARAGRAEINDDKGGAMADDTLEAKPDVEPRAFNAFIPIITLIVALGGGVWATGEGDTLSEIVGSADPYKSMMWASFIGALVAAGMSVGQGILSAHETVDAWYGGARATLFGMIVLVLAWSMSAVTSDLNAKGYLISVLGDSLPAALVPAIVFVLAAITAFSTGTSWGTMGILLPLVLPLAWAVMNADGAATDMHILYSAVACVLAGAVWGDHCSPISDTTVLSSIASGCDHIEHVRTQLPYAMMVGIVAISIGTIPGGFGLHPLVSIIAGLGILFVLLKVLGRSADDEKTQTT